MYEQILVPLDGTPLAEQALLPAVSLGGASGAHVHIVTVELPTPIDLPELPYEASVGEVQVDYLESVASRIQDAGVPCVTAEARRGVDVAEVLEAYREEMGIGLTVISSHGRGPVQRAWIGSVADRYVRASEAPVLLVRAAAEEPESPDLSRVVRFDHVLITTDGSKLSEAALEPATELGGADAAYVLARVVEPGYPLGDVGLPMEAQEAKERIEAAERLAEVEVASASQRLASKGFSVEGVTALRESVAQGILELAEAHAADMIAIATHGYGGLRRLVLGSVADKVVRGADRPVLIVRPAQR